MGRADPEMIAAGPALRGAFGTERELSQEREGTFRDVVERHGRSLRRIARSYAGSGGADHEDLYQEMLCQLWRSLPSFRGDSGLGTWVYRVALNTALSHRRQVQRHARFQAGLLPDTAPHPASVGDPKEEAAILADFLESLGEVDRSLLILYLEGMSYQEMADVTGQTEGTVGVRLHRLKQAFKRRYVER
jgi:RNA polymerase sigma-70 factor (ECF subfamily)